MIDICQVQVRYAFPKRRYIDLSSLKLHLPEPETIRIHPCRSYISYNIALNMRLALGKTWVTRPKPSKKFSCCLSLLRRQCKLVNEVIHEAEIQPICRVLDVSPWLSHRQPGNECPFVFQGQERHWPSSRRFVHSSLKYVCAQVMLAEELYK